MTLLDELTNETAKQRSLRIPLDYSRQQHWIGQYKVWFAVAAGILSASYVGWTATEAGREQLSPGSVALAHQAVGHRCDACHLPGDPLNANSDGQRWLGWQVGFGSGNPHAADEKCSTCHKTAAHHTWELKQEIASCSACHVDHLGTAADIRRPEDRLCIVCHADIAKHRQLETVAISPSRPAAGNVTGFAAVGAHPEFRSLARPDPGNIKFSHAWHMLPGQFPAGTVDYDKLVMTGAKLPAEWRAKYARDDQDRVTLKCESCHQPDNQHGAAAMLPIQFDQHCVACHEDRLKLTSGKVPHGVEGIELRAAVLGAKEAKPRQPLSPQRPIPGQPFQALQPRELFDSAETEILLGKNCSYCHERATAEDLPLPDGSRRDVKPPNLQAVWFPNARFDHHAHQHVTCQKCHPGAFREAPAKPPAGNTAEADEAQWRDDNAVLIPGLANCRECHTSRTSAPHSGARHDCAACHRYHGIEKLITQGGHP